MTDPHAGETLDSGIAIIGMAGRFPGARNVAEFWRNLRDGVESVVRYTDAELNAAGVPPALLAHPDYVKAGAPLSDMQLFDAGFFGFSPLDASIMDPQHRHFLECCWEALERAGHDPARFGGAIGVFAGSGHNAYFPYNLLTNPELVQQVGFFLLRHTGNDKDFLATRVSYQFDLRGPSVNVQTACSTSLVAIHAACQSLLGAECDLALAGGVTIELPHRHGYLYRDGEILAPDAHCRAFDAKSQGTVFGSGVGVVVLRRLADALRDGDDVLAVIRGSAVNNDGAAKVGYLAPSVDGQATAVAEALAVAGVDPAEISYVEMHGTGTALGDPIEVAALTRAFRQGTDRKGYCAIGSVKPNIGHLDTAAGVASVIKTVEAMRHRQIPPSLHYEAPNPEIDFEGSPFFVNAKLRDWTSDGAPRRAGVSSLGVGGTNAHVVLEEAPVKPPAGASREHQILLLSARSEHSLERATERLAEHLREHAELPLADVAHTLRVGRRAFERRRMLVCRNREQAISALESGDVKRLPTSQVTHARRRVAFLFPGGGAQYPNMGRGLYESEPVYRRAVDECLALLDPAHRAEIHALLFAAPEAIEDAAQRFERPSLQLPALFLVEYALAALWRAWGIEPTALAGHSMGENTAACIAGVFRLEDALALVTLRGRLFERVPPGAMLSIPLPIEQVEPLLGRELSLASINAPELCAASGPIAAIERLEAELAARDIETRRVRIDIAAHSAMLDPILPEWRAFLRSLRLAPPQIPFVSNLSGGWISEAEATDPEYWVRHLRGCVRFADGVRALCEDPDRLLLEVGPGRTLATLAKLHPSRRADQEVLHSLRHPDDESADGAFVLSVLGQLWLAGAQPDWTTFGGAETRRRVELPTYAWDHQRHWVEPGTQLYAEGLGDPLTRRRDDIGEWFYTPEWRRAPLPPAAKPAASDRVLVLGASTPLGERVTAALRERGHAVIRVDEGASFAQRGEAGFALRVGAADDYEALLEALSASGGAASRIVHLWNFGEEASSAGPVSYQRARSLAFDSLLALAQAIGRQDLDAPLHLDVVMSGVQSVAGEEVGSPLRALLLGPCRVIPRELPNVRCRAIDVAPSPRDPAAASRWLERLVSELAADAPEPLVALRGHERFVQHFEPVRLDAASAPERSRLRHGGVYLISGGLGGLGLALARHLATGWGARLVLVGRHALPPRADWPAWLEAHPEHERTRRRIRAVEELERSGAEVLVAEADVLDPAALRGVVEAARSRFGALHGVFHAAGVLDDALLETKDLAAAERVLAPKVRGTLALDAALSGIPLDFLLLYSSVSAIAGLAGQIDYTAANAFLDAFAQHRSARDASPTISVAWGAWQEVGIAAELARRAAGSADADAGQAPAHPLLGRLLRDDGVRQVYATAFAPATHWLLDEHRVAGGAALIPGTGFLELARAALAERVAGDAIEIRDTFLMAPFVVADGATRELRIEIDRASGDFSIASGEAEGSARTEHVRGTALWVAADSPDKRSLVELRERCAGRTLAFDGSVPQVHLRFGPRWSCVRQIRFGAGEALAELELPEAFAGDLPGFGLHPALLDMATGCAHALIPDFDPKRDFYVPISYARVLARGPLPRRLTSHIRHRDDHRSGRDFAIFDVTLFDEAGLPVVEIEEFMLKRIADPAALASEPSAAPAEAAVAAASGAAHVSTNPLLENLHEAIRPQEGLAALERILAAGAFPQIAVSPQPLLAWIEKLTAAPEGRAHARGAAPAVDPALLQALAEIEAVLYEHPAVLAAAVTAHFDRPGERRLLAHVVWQPDRHATVSELRRFLRGRLSEDRVPQNIVELDALPVDANGALDRARLHDPFGIADDYVAPRTETEKVIAKTWQEVLGIDRVGLHDNFFDVGGHSLLAMRVIVRTEKKLGVRLNNAIMVLQTLEQVAAECEKRLGASRASAARASAPPADDGAREGLTARLLRAVKRGAAQD